MVAMVIKVYLGFTSNQVGPPAMAKRLLLMSGAGLPGNANTGWTHARGWAHMWGIIFVLIFQI